MTSAEQFVAMQTQTCRVRCPQCDLDRKKHNPTLAITVNAGETLYKCHHCSFEGIITTKNPALDYKLPPQKVTPIPTQYNQDTDMIESFFSDRGINISNLTDLPQMTTAQKFFNNFGKADAIGFIYGDKDCPSAIKWRCIGRKLFTQDGAAREFYGLERVEPGAEEIVIVEGEPDVVALATIGIVAVSVPNGAPQKVSNGRTLPEDDKKFSYLWKARKLLGKATKIIIATDQDEAGDALAEEIARRVDRAKCWRTHLPDDCKDITDVLKAHGKDAARAVIESAEPVPLFGVYGAKSYADELYETYREGVGGGESTGFAVIDELFTVKPGMLTIVTGLPGAGKSSFVDCIMGNMAKEKSWKFAVASFENQPAMHIAMLAEAYTKKPFYAGPTPRMSKAELGEALDFIDEHFVFLELKDGTLPTIESIIDRCKQAVLRLGVRGLVIDPYSYIQQPKDSQEYQFISTMLSQVTAFAQAYDIHVWFIAHPAKMKALADGSYPVCNGHHISGSSAWYSKADIGITVHRVKGGPSEIHCWKVRFKWLGREGMAHLGYDVPTGTFYEVTDGSFQGGTAPKVIPWGDTEL